MIIPFSAATFTPISCSHCMRLWDSCAPLASAVVGLTWLGFPLLSCTCSRILVEGLAPIRDCSTTISWLREGATAESNLTTHLKLLGYDLCRVYSPSIGSRKSCGPHDSGVGKCYSTHREPGKRREGQKLGTATQSAIEAFFLLSWYIKQRHAL